LHALFGDGEVDVVEDVAEDLDAVLDSHGHAFAAGVVGDLM
jgi:hypothetical protein